MKGWKLAIVILVALFAVILVLELEANINPLTGILLQVVSYGLFIGLIFFFFYLAGRVYLKRTSWS